MMSSQDGRMVSASGSPPQDRGFESSVSQLAHKNCHTWATGDDNAASVDSAVNEYLAIDIYGNCTWIIHGVLKHVSRFMLR